MVDTRSVCNDQGRSRICLSLSDCLDGLVHISTHGDLCNVYIAVAHSDCSKVFLLNFFTACSELSNSTCRSSLGGLSACVGVNLSVEYHDVDILAACKYVVNAVESDIVSPTVTTEDPLGLLSQEIFVLDDVLACRAVNVLKSSYEFVSCSTVCSTDTECI